MHRYYLENDKMYFSAQANLAKKLLMLTAGLTLLAVGITIPTVMLMECKNPSDDPPISTTPPPLPDYTILPDHTLPALTGLPGTENPDDITDLSETTGYFTTEDYNTGTADAYTTGTYATGTYAIETRQNYVTF